MTRDARLLGFEAWMDAAMSDAGWADALQRSRALLRARGASIVVHDANASVVSTDCEAPADFVRYCRALAPRRSSGINDCRADNLGRVVWLRVEGRAERALSDVTFAVLADEALDLILFAELAMAAARAVAARARLACTQQSSALMTAAFDHVPFGVATADAQGRVTNLNDACRTLLARADGLSTRHGKLMCRDPSDQRALMEAIDKSLRGEGARVLRATRAGGAQPYVIRVLCPREAGAMRDQCVLMIIDPDDQPSPGAEIWRVMFDLTECELIIAEGLVAGRRITDIANERGVSVETVRTQTKRMFERLNVTSQVEATARLCRATPFRAVDATAVRRRAAA